VSVSYINRLIDEKIKSMKSIDNTYIKSGASHTITVTNPNWTFVVLTLKCNNEDQISGLHQITISRNFPDKIFTTVTHGTNNNNLSFLQAGYYAEASISNASDTSLTINAGDFISVSAIPNTGIMKTKRLTNLCGILQTIVM